MWFVFILSWLHYMLQNIWDDSCSPDHDQSWIHYGDRDTIVSFRFSEFSPAIMLPKILPPTHTHIQTHRETYVVSRFGLAVVCVPSAHLSELSEVSVCRAELFLGTWCQSANDDLCPSSSPPVALINRDEVCVVIFSACGCPSACLCGDECAGDGRSLGLGWTHRSWVLTLDTAGVSLHHPS